MIRKAFVTHPAEIMDASFLGIRTGICFGNKDCKKRKKERKDARHQTQIARIEARGRKKIAKVEERELTNAGKKEQIGVTQALTQQIANSPTNNSSYSPTSPSNKQAIWLIGGGMSVIMVIFIILMMFK